MFFQNYGETRKRYNFVDQTRPCLLMADSVQWLSQSDYSICISILIEFYYLEIEDISKTTYPVERRVIYNFIYHCLFCELIF